MGLMGQVLPSHLCATFTHSISSASQLAHRTGTIPRYELPMANFIRLQLTDTSVNRIGRSLLSLLYQLATGACGQL